MSNKNRKIHYIEIHYTKISICAKGLLIFLFTSWKISKTPTVTRASRLHTRNWSQCPILLHPRELVPFKDLNLEPYLFWMKCKFVYGQIFHVNLFEITNINFQYQKYASHFWKIFLYTHWILFFWWLSNLMHFNFIFKNCVQFLHTISKFEYRNTILWGLSLLSCRYENLNSNHNGTWRNKYVEDLDLW